MPTIHSVSSVNKVQPMTKSTQRLVSPTPAVISVQIISGQPERSGTSWGKHFRDHILLLLLLLLFKNRPSNCTVKKESAAKQELQKTFCWSAVHCAEDRGGVSYFWQSFKAGSFWLQPAGWSKTACRTLFYMRKRAWNGAELDYDRDLYADIFGAKPWKSWNVGLHHISCGMWANGTDCLLIYLMDRKLWYCCSKR